MKCFYINLDRATARRDAIEKSFDQHKRPGWTLTRIAAVDAAQVRDLRLPGLLRDEEKACLLSHKKAIGADRGTTEHVLILEDDAVFGPSTFAGLENLLARADAGAAWDVIYADAMIVQVSAMAALLTLRQDLAARGAVMLLDLAPFHFLKRTLFAGATAYVVNRATTAKLYSWLDTMTTFDQPYDLLLRDEVYDGRLKGFLTFPFLTSVSPLADESAIQHRAERNTDMAWNAYRRMVWRDGDWRAGAEVVADLSREISPEAKLYGTLWACMIDQGFKVK